MFGCGGSSNKNEHSFMTATLHQEQIGVFNKTSWKWTSVGYNVSSPDWEGQIRSIGPCWTKPISQPLIPIFLLIGLFFSGILIAWLVNCIVQKRDRKERKIHIYHDKPS